VTHLVIYGLAGQTLRHVVPARVATATYEITDLRKAQGAVDRVIASGAATVPAWTLTTDAPAGPSEIDGREVPVTATAGPSIGDSAAIISTDGSFEAFEIAAIEAGAHLVSASYLAAEYPTGSTVEGLTISAAVPVGLYDFEDALDDQRPLRIEWRYTLDGSEVRVTEPIQLTRQTDALSSRGPSVAHVRGGYPDVGRNLLEGLTVEGLAEVAELELRSELDSRGLDYAAIMIGAQGITLLAARIVHEAATRGYAPGMVPLADFRDYALTDYATKLEALAVGTPGRTSIMLDTEAVANHRTDTTIRGPLGPM
jgi:hypothetical protein